MKWVALVKQYQDTCLVLCIALGVLGLFVWSLIPTPRQSNTSLSKNSGMKIGVWIYDLASAERGDPARIVAKAKQYGLDYIVVRTYHRRQYRGRWYEPIWAPGCPSVVLSDLVSRAHREGIKVYAWAYNYPFYVEEQLRLTRASLDIADGFVFNAETPFCMPNAYDSVAKLCEPIRAYRDQRYPKKLLACSTYARANRGIGKQFPYVLFNQFCDVLWVQSYHKTFELQADQTVTEIDRVFEQKYAQWRQEGNAQNIRTIVHTAEAYTRESGFVHVPAAELELFLTTAIHAGHREVNIWRWELLGTEHWNVLAQVTGTPVPSSRLPNARPIHEWVVLTFAAIAGIVIIWVGGACLVLVLTNRNKHPYLRQYDPTGWYEALHWPIWIPQIMFGFGQFLRSLIMVR